MNNKSRSGEPETDLDWDVPSGKDEGEVLRDKSTTPTSPSFPVDSGYGAPLGVFAEGSQFGVYVVGPCIGEGGMARIYRAEHEGLRRQVALKVLSDGFSKDTEGRERFLREARIAAAIKHPNVVNIFDVGVHQGVTYLVMELLEGEDLETLVQSRGALDEATIVDIIVPVVAGLVAVHDAGIVHRDLKPGNIFLAKGRNDEMEPKLLDFGISKSIHPEQLKLTSANGLLMGTPFYMSPEGIQGKEMTHLSDQYSLGVVLYECATGKNPFMAGSFPEVVNLITTGKYVTASQHVPPIPRRLCRIIERAMSLEPEKRFRDLREMGRELLLLAGQRTRITWGLSFGDLNRAALARAQEATASEVAARGNGARGNGGGDVNFRPRRGGKIALAALLLLLGGGAAAYFLVPGLSSKLSGQGPVASLDVKPAESETHSLSPVPGRDAPAGSAAPAEPAPGAVNDALHVEPSQAVAREVAGRDLVANDGSRGVLADDPSTGRGDERGESREDERETKKSKSKADKLSSRTRDRAEGARRRTPTSTTVRRSTGGETNEVDWILPEEQALVQQRPRGPRLGTNNAPILD